MVVQLLHGHHRAILFRDRLRQNQSDHRNEHHHRHHAKPMMRQEISSSGSACCSRVKHMSMTDPIADFLTGSATQQKPTLFRGVRSKESELAKVLKNEALLRVGWTTPRFGSIKLLCATTKRSRYHPWSRAGRLRVVSMSQKTCSTRSEWTRVILTTPKVFFPTASPQGRRRRRSSAVW